MKFNEIINDKKPREKAIKYGLDNLRDEEVLAIILRTGTKEKNVLKLSQEIIEIFNGLEGFNKMNLNSLIKIKGIGKSKALELLSCLELAKRIKLTTKQKQYIKILSPEDTFNLIKNYFLNLENEHFLILLLNNQNKIIHQKILYKGTLNTLNIDIKDIIYQAIIYKSNKIICVHNHPSGDSEPSIKDIETTKSINKQLGIFDIKLIDHIIIGNNNYYSINLEKKYLIYNC